MASVAFFFYSEAMEQATLSHFSVAFQMHHMSTKLFIRASDLGYMWATKTHLVKVKERSRQG